MLRKAESHKEWRRLVVKSTVVPQRSAGLRDRSDKRRQDSLSKKGRYQPTILAGGGSQNQYERGVR